MGRGPPRRGGPRPGRRAGPAGAEVRHRAAAWTATSTPSSPPSTRPTPASTPTRPGCSSTRCATSAAPASTVTTPAATGCASSASRAVKLSQDFGRHIRDDVRTVRLAPEQLDGLPEDYRAAHPRRRGRPGHHHHRLPRPGAVHRPSAPTRGPPRAGPGRRPTSPGRPTTRCSRTCWPCAARPRTLLGYDSWPDYDAEVKMIGTGPRSPSSSTGSAGCHRACRPSEVASCWSASASTTRRRGGRRPTTRATTPSSCAASSTTSTARSCGPTSASSRSARASSTSPAGCSASSGRPSRARRPAPGTPRWRRTTSAWTGGRIGRIHLDLHPREGKFKHAAQFDMVAGHRGRASCPRACWCATSPAA